MKKHHASQGQSVNCSCGQEQSGDLPRRQDGPGTLPLHVPHEALQYPQCSRDKIQPIKQKQSRHHAMTALLMFSKFHGWGSGIPTGRLFRCTEWSAAESLARFSPPRFCSGYPLPGVHPWLRSLLPVSASDPAVLAPDRCRAADDALTVLIAEVHQEKFPVFSDRFRHCSAPAK